MIIIFKKTIFRIVIVALFFSCEKQKEKINFTTSESDLSFTELATSWDEAIPLGNGTVGALVWKKKGKLRLSLDRSDLWDLRPVEVYKGPEWKRSWVKKHWKQGTYNEVHDRFDNPYGKLVGPTKIPGATLEFDVAAFGPVTSVHLYHKEAMCVVTWENGIRFKTFVHATNPVGWYQFEGVKDTVSYTVIPPAYVGEKNKKKYSKKDLRSLNYPKGIIEKGDNFTTYTQEGWEGFTYQLHLQQQKIDNGIEGCWSISSQQPQKEKSKTAKTVVSQNIETGWLKALKSHIGWWNDFWSKSSIKIPDAQLEKQWYLEQYKFGSVARQGAPPISLQAVWTADNGQIPPWKGDFHHDLNTQASYWSSYSANHLEGETGFTDWLWKHREGFKTYTKTYFETDGLNVPGITSLDGSPMGGWHQYAAGSTVSSWLGQHFYLHWRYSMDRDYLKERAYPWIKDVAIYLDQTSVKDAQGNRKLEMSSSPEIFNNTSEAWFKETSNFDLASVKWTFEKAEELALELNLQEEAAKWKAISKEWPDFATDDTGFLFAPGIPYDKSHRHFSHLMAFHPLGLVDVSNGASDLELINNTIATIDKHGTQEFIGFSFPWRANLKARAFDGDRAVKDLKTYATSFTHKNTFHSNGERTNKGLSRFKYRAFTLEANFMFAAALQEMLIQSHSGKINLFPAIPKNWKDASFKQLRTEGAFLIDAELKDGKVAAVTINSEKGGLMKMTNPFKGFNYVQDGKKVAGAQLIELDMQQGEKIVLSLE